MAFGTIERVLALDDAALRIRLRVRLGVFLDDVQVLEDERGASSVSTRRTLAVLPASLPLTIAHLVAFANL